MTRHVRQWRLGHGNDKERQVPEGRRAREGRSVAAKHLTPEDLAERMGVPVMTVYAWNSRGGGPRYMKIGKHVRYKLADVEAWENRHYVEQVAVC
ncbi:helix-turn-helix transcriptional regulator [Nonomuraea thailandensis]